MPAKLICDLMNNLATNIPAKSQMRKFRLQISVLALLLLSIYTSGQGKYSLIVRGADKDDSLLLS